VGTPEQSSSGVSTSGAAKSRSTTRSGTGSGRTASRTGSRINADSIGWYLSNIGRVPLLTAAEEIELAHHVQAGKRLLQQPDEQLSPQQRRQLRMAQRARERMMSANLRLVVSVAKKYQHQGLELLDLVQEGAIGLERAVDKFDPAMGYKFSTYAYWWIRQGMTRAIDNSARTIRLPIHVSEKLSKMRRVSRELSHRLGRQPNRLELAHALGMKPGELDDLITQSAPCTSLDAHARGDEDRSTLGELIADPESNQHFDAMDRHLQKEHLGAWLSQLNEREQTIIKLRFGLEGSEPLTLAEIGRMINVSRERVRQLEAKAIMKLRLLSNLHKAA
jgi:RNA polymerase primary sigma factor